MSALSFNEALFTELYTLLSLAATCSSLHGICVVVLGALHGVDLLVVVVGALEVTGGHGRLV